MRTHDFAEMHDCGMKTIILPFYDQHFLLQVFIIVMRTHDFAKVHNCGKNTLILPFYEWDPLIASLQSGRQDQQYSCKWSKIRLVFPIHGECYSSNLSMR